MLHQPRRAALVSPVDVGPAHARRKGYKRDQFEHLFRSLPRKVTWKFPLLPARPADAVRGPDVNGRDVVRPEPASAYLGPRHPPRSSNRAVVTVAWDLALPIRAGPSGCADGDEMYP